MEPQESPVSEGKAMKTVVRTCRLAALLLIGVTATHCESPVESYNPLLIGTWMLDTFRVGVDVGYSGHYPADNFRIKTMTLLEDRTFTIDYAEPDSAWTLAGNWRIEGHRLVLRFPDGTDIKGGYSVSETDFVFGTHMLLEGGDRFSPNTSVLLYFQRN